MTAHVIKVSALEAIKVSPEGEGVRIAALMAGREIGHRVANLDQVGVLLFALEQAAEVAERARQLNRAREQAGAA
jgi:hypothetical protein